MKKMFLAVAVFALVMMPMAGMALNMTGALTTPAANGVDGTEQYATNFRIAWEIKDSVINPGWLTYTYFITGATYNVTSGVYNPLEKGLSHLIIQVSDDFKATDIKNANTGYELKTYSGADPSNPYMPGEIYGLKFEPILDPDTLPVISFDSDRMPVDGNFYAKDGKNSIENPTPPPPNFSVDVTAWNTGLDPDYIGTKMYIKAPDTAFTPIPGSLLLLGSGILGLVGLRRKLF